MSFSWASALRIAVLLLLLAAVITACFTLPVEKIMKDFLLWVDHDLGPWGPFVLAIAYIPLTVLAVPASVLTMGTTRVSSTNHGFKYKDPYDVSYLVVNRDTRSSNIQMSESYLGFGWFNSCSKELTSWEN